MTDAEVISVVTETGFSLHISDECVALYEKSGDRQKKLWFIIQCGLEEQHIKDGRKSLSDTLLLAARWAIWARQEPT